MDRILIGIGACSLVSASFIALSLTTAACDDKKVQLAPSASALASVVVPTGATTKRYTIDAESKTFIEMDAPKEKIKANTKGGTGSLEIDFTNLANSRGEVKMDLSNLTTTTFTDQEKNSAQTTHARTWLEVADGESGKLDDKVKETNRYAVYAIRSIENPSATDVSKVPATKDGADDVRQVTMTTKGELLIHGHKVPHDGDVTVTFKYPPGAAADAPASIGIKTKTPFKVTLAEHDVKPRDGFGKIAKGSFHLLGTKVADVADISLDLRAVSSKP